MIALPAPAKALAADPKDPPTAVVRMPLPIANLARRLAEGSLRAGDINGFLDNRGAHVARRAAGRRVGIVWVPLPR